MAITNLYPNLPGHLVEFKDGGQQLRNVAVTGNSKSLLILGTAIDGPVNEPVAIDAETVHMLFGNDVDSNGVPNGATISKYARQAFKCGFNDIRCMRVTGSPASATIVTNSVVETEAEKIDISVPSNGNKRTTIQLPLGTIPTGCYTAITNVVASHNIVGSGLNTSYGAGKINIPDNIVPARGDINVDYVVQIIDPSVLATNTTSVAVDTDEKDPVNGIWSVKVHFNNIIDMYNYDLTGLTVGTATQDNHGVPTTAGNIVEITTDSGEIVYGTVILKNASNGTTETIVSASIDANNTLTLEYEVNATSQTISSVVFADTLEYVSYTKTDNNTVITQSDLYAPINVALNASKPYVNGDVVLYDATGLNVIAKINDGSNVIVYNSANNEFIVDLSSTLTSIPVGYITPGSLLKLSYVYEHKKTFDEKITFESIYGGTVYNESKVTIDVIFDDNGNEGRLITLIKPDSKKYSVSENPLSFRSFDYPTIGLLRNAVESHSLNNVFKVVVEADHEDTLTGTIPVGASNSIMMQFTGGTNGINPTNDEMFIALSGERDSDGYLIKRGAYQVLENYNVDYIYVAGVYADSKVSPSVSKNSFHYELALLCAVLTYRTKMVHGFIDFKPNTNTTLIGIQSYVDKLLKYDNTHYMKDTNGDIIYDENNSPMDIGWYTSAVVGPEPICSSPTLGTYYGSPALAYASLNANLKAQSAPTNKALPGCTGVRYKLSNKQMNDLVNNRMVVFKTKNEGVSSANTLPYVVDGCTCGTVNSDYARITTVKVVTQCVDEIREVADPFIGEPNTVEQRNALAALISKRLMQLKTDGVIQYFEFEISATVEQVLIGECLIALTLVAPQELRKIRTVVSLRTTA